MRNEMVSHRNVAQHLVQQLIKWGCKRIYGVIGDANLFFLNELSSQNEIQYIACRHEMDAALMASAEAKLTGRLAVCTSTCGPGITVLLNGLADAWRDKAPVLAITGQVERSELGTGAVQDIDQQKLISPIASYSALVSDNHSFPKLLNIAMKKALGQGGVAHLSVPKDIWLLPVTGGFYPLAPKKPVTIPTTEDKVTAEINRAKRPIILAGRGIKQARTEVLQFAEKIQSPIMTTMPAKCFVPNDHPLFVGGLGQAGTEISRELLKESDLCIIVGATWWPADYVPPSISIIQIDVISENIGHNFPTIGSLVGEMSSILHSLIAQVQPKQNPEYMNEISEKKIIWNKKIQSEVDDPSGSLTEAKVIAELNQWIDPNAIITADTGNHTLWLERIFQFQNQELLLSGTWRTLGFSLPAGIAAQLEYPEKQVVCIAGDGGVAHSIIDLITAVTYKLPLTLIIINNGSYFMEKSRMIVEELEALGSEIPNPDYVALGRSMGAEGFVVKRLDELQPVIRQALDSKQTSVVEIHTTASMLPHTKILKGNE